MSTTKGQNESAESASWSSWLLDPFGRSATTTTTQTPSELADPSEADGPSAVITAEEPPIGEPSSPATLPMAGTWQKDEGASDGEAYAKQVAMLHMSSLYNYAALHYMWGLDLTVDDRGFTKKYLVKHVPAYIFSEVEQFKFGESTTMGRRDRRKGSQEAIAHTSADGISCDIKWTDPYAGTVKESYDMPSAQVLRITSTLTMGDQVVTAVQVYNKK